MTVAYLLGVKTLLNQHEAGAAGRGFEGDRHLSLVAANAVCAFPGPGEAEAMRRIDESIDAAGCDLVAIA
jgi:hypothetical protein